MGAAALLVLFFLGLLLSTIGGIIGVVDAFRVSTVWGLLALFIPFALLVFCIKFWNQRKWARNSLIISLIGLGTTLLSLPLLGGLGMMTARNQMEEDFEDFTVEDIPVDPNAQLEGESDGTTEVPTEGNAELFEEAMLPGLPTAAEIARAELLPSTDPNERVKEIERERSDPYAYVPIPPAVKPPPPAPAGGGTATNGGNNNNPPTQTAAGGTGTAPIQTPTAPSPGNGTAGQSPSVPSRPIEPLPALPEPTVVASQVEISGVASVNGKTYAIVKAPGEPTSRYVRVGDRLSSGAVLVKRIENRPGTTPVVVLEERGEEVALPVGSNVGVSEEPTASLPLPSSNFAALPVLP